MVDTPATQQPVPNPARYRTGLVLAVIGAAGFVPGLALALFVPEWRPMAALGVVAFWVVWKIGRTMMKFASGAA